MKKIFKACTILCALMAILLFVFGIRALFGKSFIIGIRLFNMAAGGSFNGFIGNILNMAISVFGFGAMGFYGLKVDSDTKAMKPAFSIGIIMSLICLISMVFAITSRSFTMGDLTVFLLPVIYTVLLFKNA